MYSPLFRLVASMIRGKFRVLTFSIIYSTAKFESLYLFGASGSTWVAKRPPDRCGYYATVTRRIATSECPWPVSFEHIARLFIPKLYYLYVFSGLCTGGGDENFELVATLEFPIPVD
jgi:hypothetical protein